MSNARLAIPDFQFGAIDAQWQAVTGGYFIYRHVSTSDTLSMQLISTGATGSVTLLKSNVVDTSESIQDIKDKFLPLLDGDDAAIEFTVGTSNEEKGTNDIYRSAFIGIFVADTVISGLVEFYDKLK